MINVWQTLDLIAGSDLKNRIEGYQDVNNMLKVFSKRDSFSRDLQNDQRRVSKAESIVFNASGSNNQTPSSKKKSTIKIKTKPSVRSKDNKSKSKYYRYGQQKVKPKIKEEILPEDYEAVIDCSFNLPRISARLERLMGTNVVRLTDRKYMKQLRQRLQDDYILTLNKRIEARELKELERERNLILEGKTDIIPDELANHPIFIVNRRVNKLIAKRRAKMKTIREKNAEKLLRQGVKWERERLIYDELDRQKEDDIREIKLGQKALEEKYKKEDAKRGVDLLRILDREYKDCELDLKEFLRKERERMKARYAKKPYQYSSDPMDIVNIVRKRKKFRETERKIRQELEDKLKMTFKTAETKKILARAAATSEVSRRLADEELTAGGDNNNQTSAVISEDTLENLSLVINITHRMSQSESVYLAKLVTSMEDDVLKEFLVSKAQFDELNYSDPRVARLKLTNNIRELYLLAEEIITDQPERREEEEEEFGEEDTETWA